MEDIKWNTTIIIAFIAVLIPPIVYRLFVLMPVIISLLFGMGLGFILFGDRWKKNSNRLSIGDVPVTSDSVIELISSMSKSLPPINNNPIISISVGPVVDKTINQLLDLFMRDFIYFWYSPLKWTNGFQFEQSLRSSLAAVIMNLIEYGQRLLNQNKFADAMSMIIYSIGNVLIVHLVSVI